MQVTAVAVWCHAYLATLNQTTVVAGSVAAGFVVSELLCFIVVFYILATLRANSHAFSVKTYAMHRQYTQLLVLQLTNPLVMFVLPSVAVLSSIVFPIGEYWTSTVAVQFGYIWLDVYALNNCLLTIFFVTPYRRHCIGLILQVGNTLRVTPCMRWLRKRRYGRRVTPIIGAPSPHEGQTPRPEALSIHPSAVLHSSNVDEIQRQHRDSRAQSQRERIVAERSSGRVSSAPISLIGARGDRFFQQQRQQLLVVAPPNFIDTITMVSHMDSLKSKSTTRNEN